jgi:hypothetical protein
MSDGNFPYRPEEPSENFFEVFLRTSSIAWIVWISYRFFESTAVDGIIARGGIINSIPIKGSLLFFITILATYFTNSSKTRVYRQSIT